MQHPDFVVLNAFKRIDWEGKGHINTLDLLEFFKDNGVSMGEAECYLVLSHYDSNKDGKLSLIE